MDNNQSVHDLISYLPLNIIHSILALVPIRDAVRTCILSRQWRYKWAALPHLVFDDESVDETESEDSSIECLKNMVTNVLLLHQGPIQRFKLSFSLLTSCPETDRWLLCLSRNEIRELCLTMGEFDNDDDDGGDGDRWSRVHSSLYSCQKLTHLELNYCELPPPPATFDGFSCLRSLVLNEIRMSCNVFQSLIANSPLLENLRIESLDITEGELRITAPIYLKCLSSLVIRRARLPSKVVESLIANAPLLENFTFESSDGTELRISAPNLKSFDLAGNIKEISIYAPLVVQVSVFLYNTGFTAEQQQCSLCNYANFFGSLTNLERLVGDMKFTEYLSIGIESYDHSLVFHHLKSILLEELNFDDKKQVAIVGHLIMGAPNLDKFKISILRSPNASEASPIALSYSDFGWAPDFTINKLRFIKVDVDGVHSEMEFIKILLARSTVLECMTVFWHELGAGEISNMMEELLSYRRASPNANISFPSLSVEMFRKDF